ncbi:MAG: hypothetical protein K1X74_23285, partial [Pirellulales bacterium]|nr:hypothetical protein [Pirellulales bacterium]
NEQKRIRDNLQALGDRSAEKELRERFVRTLSSQEDRLEKIQQETEAVNRKREASLEKIQAALGKLEYEVSLK